MDKDTKEKYITISCCAIIVIIAGVYLYTSMETSQAAYQKIDTLEKNKDMVALLNIIEDPKSNSDEYKYASDAISTLYDLNDTQMNKLVDAKIAEEYKKIMNKEDAEKNVNYGNFMEREAAYDWAKDNGYDIKYGSNTPF